MNVKLPEDPMILLSYINMKLRDEYASLRELCEDLGADADELTARLSAVGFRYDGQTNRFR